MIKVVEYRGDKKTLVKFMEDLQDYLIQLDSLKRLRRLSEYGEIYADNLIKKVKQHNGIIYIAESDNLPVGVIAGILEDQIKDNDLGCIPSKSARILELIVNEKYRGRNIGSLLMSKTEGYFKAQGCDIVRVEVFEPNRGTHAFYQKCGYQDRMIDMAKTLRKVHTPLDS